MRRMSAVMVVLLVVGLLGVVASAAHQDCPPFPEKSEFRVVEKKGRWIKLAPCDRFQSEYQWSFGDGSRHSTFFDEAVTHRYERDGIYSVTLRTEDLFGEESVTRRQVRIGVPARAEVRVSVKVELDELPPEALVFGTVPLLFLLLSSGS